MVCNLQSPIPHTTKNLAPNSLVAEISRKLKTRIVPLENNTTAIEQWNYYCSPRTSNTSKELLASCTFFRPSSDCHSMCAWCYHFHSLLRLLGFEIVAVHKVMSRVISSPLQPKYISHSSRPKTSRKQCLICRALFAPRFTGH